MFIAKKNQVHPKNTIPKNHEKCISKVSSRHSNHEMVCAKVSLDFMKVLQTRITMTNFNTGEKNKIVLNLQLS